MPDKGCQYRALEGRSLVLLRKWEEVEAELEARMNNHALRGLNMKGLDDLFEDAHSRFWDALAKEMHFDRSIGCWSIDSSFPDKPMLVWAPDCDTAEGVDTGFLDLLDMLEEQFEEKAEETGRAGVPQMLVYHEGMKVHLH